MTTAVQHQQQHPRPSLLLLQVIILVILTTTATVTATPFGTDPINTVEVTETVDGDVYEEPLCTSPTNTFTSRVNLYGGELGKKKKPKTG